MPFTILSSSYSNSVYTISLDPESSTLKTSSIEIGYHPSWITFHPSDKSLAFTGLEQANGKIIAIKYDGNYKGTVVAESSSGGMHPCDLAVVKDELLIANYGNGTVSTLPVSKDAPYILAEAPTHTITLSGSGPNKGRQERSHAHQVFYSEEYDELFVPDLGGDRVYRLKQNANGVWTIESHIDNEPGSGPRHVAIYDGRLYTLLELKSLLAAHSLPDAQFFTKTSTMFNPPTQPNYMLAAAILLPKPNATFTVPYIYVSNRNDPSPEGDSVAIFSIANPDAPELIAEVRTGLDHLRGMAFGGPDDKYLVAGGANGGGVKVFERTEGGKNLKLIAEDPSVKAPTGFIWV
ncbi:3-carboxy-cis,cis-mucoante lactonizing enzyme [Rhodocollybia butyracea]|uniref:3-carboxy-cis,cis-mucoante lactonizing enzyme n=1 Tax=Rhodocollybia butyracea TaxID=206335 RepID=A0A9P5UD69_9AGAR|nr:3-carboxy-cis,cis-mucoante lactonizing enzyme [Rhodocollybia butyracea]